MVGSIKCASIIYSKLIKLKKKKYRISKSFSCLEKSTARNLVKF